MFGIPGKSPVTITPKAVSQIRRLMERDNRFGLKIGVKKGGCAGMEYTMDYVDAAEGADGGDGPQATIDVGAGLLPVVARALEVIQGLEQRHYPHRVLHARFPQQQDHATQGLVRAEIVLAANDGSGGVLQRSPSRAETIVRPKPDLLDPNEPNNGYRHTRT